jgi:hypothetical protein
MAYSTACLFSTVKNISGGSRTFGFLPPHGRKLAANEEFSVFGNILEAIQTGIDRNASRRNITAFQSALANGTLEIIKTPNPILLNGVGQSKMVRIDRANNLSLSDPCWESVV